jgi:hypothetical protein
LVEPAQGLSPCFNTKLAKADVATLSSSDTEEALELLCLSPPRGPHSPLSETCSSFGSDLFNDWPEANDMAVSVYCNTLCYGSPNYLLITFIRGLIMHQVIWLITSSRNKMEFNLILV